MRTPSISKSAPTSVAEAKQAILDFLSSDGSDDVLHELSKASLKFLEQNAPTHSRETHRMRMAVVAWRVEKK